MDLLHALLDLADAISTAVGLTAFWYAWCGRRTRARCGCRQARARPKSWNGSSARQP
jgi:hypothetical protein